MARLVRPRAGPYQHTQQETMTMWKIGHWLEIDTRAGLLVRCWPLQFHWSGLGLYADSWSTLRANGEVS